jgi:hypothetical protein
MEAGAYGFPPGVTTVNFSNIASANAIATTSLTLSGTAQYQPTQMSALGQSVTLPNALQLPLGGPQFIIDNSKGTYPVGLRDNTGALLFGISAGGVAYASLSSNSSQAGAWTINGTNLEPGFITIDNTFSNTFSATYRNAFVALDSNTSIHFASIASGFSAFIVDNKGKVVSTPVTVDAGASMRPIIAYKIDATDAIVFYGDGTTSKVVVLTLTGASPTLSLTVNTAQSTTAPGGSWGGEDSQHSPVLIQLSSTLYSVGYTIAAVASTFAISVSGVSITIGAAVNMLAANALSNSVTMYALTSTTALMLVLNTSTIKVNAAVISIAGSTSSVGTVVATASSTTQTSGNPVASSLLSSTKAVVALDNNGAVQMNVVPLTIAGNVITVGSELTVESSSIIQSSCLYKTDNATRFNPHFWLISAGGSNVFGMWYFDTNGVSRVVILTENSGTITAGTIVYNSISSAATNAVGNGIMMQQGITEFSALRCSLSNTAGFGLYISAHKINGSTITVGDGQNAREANQLGLSALNFAKDSSGNYCVLVTSTNASGSVRVPVFRSNGDVINYRGAFSIPEINVAAGTTLTANPSSNRFVIIGSTIAGTNGLNSQQLRLLNVEMAA